MTDADGDDFYLSDPRTGRQFIFDYNHMSEFSRGRGTGLPQVPYNAVTKSYAYSPISNTLDATAKLINAVGHREGTWSETPAWFRTKLSVASDASIALSFSDVSDAHQFFTSPLRSSNNLDYRANPPHGRNTDIGCR